MTKFCLLVAALAGSASAFAPESGRPSTALKAGYVGGEGPEPIPFSSAGTSVNFDPIGFAEVRKKNNNSLEGCVSCFVWQ